MRPCQTEYISLGIKPVALLRSHARMQGFQINLPAVVACRAGNLPQHLLTLTNLDEAHPDLLAMNSRHRGERARPTRKRY